jgi:hypothetical protein
MLILLIACASDIVLTPTEDTAILPGEGWREIPCEPNEDAVPTRFWMGATTPGGPRPVVGWHLYTHGFWQPAPEFYWTEDGSVIKAPALADNAVDCRVFEWAPF